MENPQKGNKSQKEHITSIYEEYSTPSRVLRSFTNLANTVIQTALSGQSKFVLEILQNADDSYEDEHKSIQVQFILQGHYLIVNHNGKGFDFNDVERICDYASQLEEVKATDLSKTGYKGLGFKSLFNLSDCIYIHSNGYSFRFDKRYWPDPDSKPWQVIPVWCEYDELPLYRKYTYDHSVNIVLKVNDVNLLASQLRELVEQPEMLLYVHRINQLSVSFNDKTHFLEKRVEGFGVFNKIDFYKNQHAESTWFSKTYKRPVSQCLRLHIGGLSRFIYPEKIKNANEVAFTFALKSDKTLKEISKIRGLCYSTFPTQLDLTLPYHINSLFILNLDRTQLHENEWNEFLIEQLGYLQLKLLNDLAVVEYLKYYVIQIFVRKINHPYVKFSKAFLKGFNTAKEEIGWLPSHQGNRLLRLGEVWIDDIEFFKQNFQNIRNHKIYPYLINYEIKYQHLLLSSKDEANHYTYDMLFQCFPTKYYPQLTKDAYVNFICYLYERLKNNSSVKDKLQNVNFLVAKDRKLVSPKNAILEESKNPIPNFFMLNTIDNDYLPLKNNNLIKNWLTNLGARRLNTPIQILRESVFKWIDSCSLDNKINIDNHIGVMSYLAQYVMQLTNNETEKLKENLRILTESKQFTLAKLCYFPDAISVKELSIVLDDKIISSSYDINDLGFFFIRIGVTNKLNITDVLRKTILTWTRTGKINDKITRENYKPIIEFIADNFPKLKKKLEESEIKEFNKLPVLTLSQTFQIAQDCYFDTAVPNVKGLEGVIPNNKIVFNISNSVCDLLTKIGVKYNIDPREVIRKSVLKWIQEGDIANRITKDNHYDIIKYMGEHWNTLSMSLSIKEKNDLKKMLILTESGVFREAYSCYWSVSVVNETRYEEIPGIKSVISPDEFVYSGYNTEALKYFLQILGVRNIRFIDIYEKYSDHLELSENMKWFFSQLENHWERNKNYKDQLLSYLQQKFRTSPCLLVRNGRMYPSIELHSSQFDNIYDIDRNAIHLLQYKNLPYDLEKYLGLKTDLDIKCILQFLRAISKNTKLGQDKTVIFFTTMLEQLKKIHKNEVKKSQLSLLALDNTLTFAKDLYYFTEENATCYLKSCYLKRIVGMSHEDTLELAELCGVNTLTFQQEIIREKEMPDNSLKEFFLESLPFIALQESKCLNEDVSSTLKVLYNKVCSIKLYQCCSIHVKYPFGDSTKINHHFEDLTLYVVCKWIKKKTTINAYLKEKLGLRTDVRDILDMEQPITRNDKNEWLENQEEDPQKLYFIETLLESLLSNKEMRIITSASVSGEHISASPVSRELTSIASVSREPIPAEPFSSDTTSDAHVSREPTSFEPISRDIFAEPVLSDTTSDAPVSREPTQAANFPETSCSPNVAEYTARQISTSFNTYTCPFKSDDIIEVDISLLISSELVTGSKKHILLPGTGSNVLSTGSLRTGCLRYLQEVRGEISDTKYISEKFVFICLQEHYRNKYPNSQFNLSDEIFTLRWRSIMIEIIWVNASGDKRKSYDFLLKNDGEIKQIIKVKSPNDVTNNDLFNIWHCKFISNVRLLAAKLQDHISEDFIEGDTRWLISSECELNVNERKRQLVPEILRVNFPLTENVRAGSATILNESGRETSGKKILSEKLVFTFLQDYYKNKYPNSQFKLSDDKFTLRWRYNKIEIFWMNASGEKGQSYDILLKKRGQD